MSWINVTNAVYAVFVAYVAYTVISLSQLLTIPPCEKGDQCLTPYLSSDEPRLQLFVYTSLFSNPSSESDMDLAYHNLFFDHKSDVSNGDADMLINLTLPRSVRRKNITMYLHMFLAAGDVKFKSWLDLASSSSAVHAGSDLVVHHTPPPSPFTLLGDDKNKSHSSSSKGSASPGAPPSRPTPHLRSVVPFSVMTDLRRLPRNKMPPEITHLIRTVSGSRRYVPFLHVELLGQRLEHLVAVADLPEGGAANTTLRYTSTGLPRLRLWMQMEAALQSLSQLGFSPHDVDEVKGIFATSAPLLALTFAVSILHLLFDVLAFKNDISFWRGRDSLAGLSGGAVLWRAFAQAIIFLHLLEEDTSLLVLAPAGVAVIIELWKVSKAYRMRYSRAGGPAAAAEDETRALDSQAFHYLSFVLYPLCGAGAVYSLLYVPHKSWYSWVVSSAVNGVYAFGFLFMLPQLFINYKLKSVAHLPWRAFMYKAFNTFIDDLFAFIITMPTSHRLACFRDDVVFLIYLYQRWLYPVDKSRINEFGGSGEEPQEGDKIKGAPHGDKKKKKE